MFAFISRVQLALDSLDRLVETLEERGPLTSVEAARSLFATSSISEGLAGSLLTDLTAGDSRVVCAGATVSLAEERHDPLLEEAAFVVFDLETTGLSAARDRICELGAARVRGLELVDFFQSLANPGVALPEPVARLTGLRERELRNAPSVASVVRRFLAFAGDDLLVAHNARFDQRFLERQLLSLHGRRLSEPPLCTAALARRLLEGRRRRVGLASLAQFFGVSTQPCHRALPDAEATAEVLVHLIGLAQELGATRLSDLRALAAPRRRRVYGKRSLTQGAPTRPGVYLFRDRHGHVLYVGRARDLRARLRSYFRSERQRPSVEAALLALDRIEWHVLGSELEAALEELRLIRELAPPANSRSRPKERGFYIRPRGDDYVVTTKPTPLGPIPSRRKASLAARALAAGPLPELRARLTHLAENLRYEEAARLRDRIEALEHVKERLRRLERLRNLEVCLVAPAIEPGWKKAFVVSGGRVCAVHTLPPGATPPAVRRTPSAEEPLTPEQAEDLLLIGSFVRRPPPELKVFAQPLEPGVLGPRGIRSPGLAASLPRKRFNECGAGGLAARTKGDAMTGKTDFTDQEWELVREGPPTAGMITLLASSGGTFRETWALAKTFAEARQQQGESELLDALVAEKPDMKRYHSREEAENEGLSRLSQAVALLDQKASPEEVESYKRFTLSVAQRVAEAHEEHGTSVSAEERDALAKIESTLNPSAA